MIEHCDGLVRFPVTPILVSRHRAVMPRLADDGVWVKGLDPYWQVRPVCGIRPLWMVFDQASGVCQFAALTTLGHDPIKVAAGTPANDNKGWTSMKKLMAECVIMWVVATSLICWAIGWYFAFAPQLGGFHIGGQTLYLPLQYVFWELRPQDEWIQKLGHVATGLFTALAVYRFQKDFKRIEKPFNEGEMGTVASGTKRGLFH